VDAAARDYVINTLCILTLLLPFSYAVTRMLTFRHPWAYILGYSFGAVGLRIVLGINGLDGLDNIIQTILIPGVILAAARDKFSLRAFAAVLAMAAMQAVDMLGTAFLASLGTEITAAASSSLLANPGAYILARAVTLLIAAIVLYLLVVVWNRLLRKSGSWALLVFVLFPLSQALLVWFSTSMLVKAGGGMGDYYSLIVFILIGVAADAVMLLAIKQLRAGDEARSRAEFLEKQMEQQRLYYRRVKQDAEDTARVRHDLRNQLQTAYVLISEGNSASAEKIFDGLADRISSAQYFCDNAVVNAVLNEKAEQCRRAGIALECSAALAGAQGISEIDLCSLFANVLDNAVNGCLDSGAEKPFIRISAAVKKGYLALNCVNSAKKREIKTASPGDEHGWGLSILREMAARRDGTVETAQTDGTFEIKVFLKCPEGQSENGTEAEKS
jgi:hypothetical protein